MPPWIAYLLTCYRRVIEAAGSLIEKLLPKHIHAVMADVFKLEVALFALPFRFSLFSGNLFFKSHLFPSLWHCRYSPNHISNIVYHQKRTEFINGNAYRSPLCIAILLYEPIKDNQRVT
jgi:hypothetical protein